MSRSLFEIFGVTTKEDAWTNALQFLLKQDSAFLKRVLKIFSPDTPLYLSASVKYLLRPKVADIGHPDLIIYDETESWFVLIETKLYAGEGDKQTARYAENGVVARHCGLTGAKELFIFLHLIPGQTARSEAFKSFCWKDLIPILKSHPFSNEYSRLIAADMVNLLEDLYSFNDSSGAIETLMNKAERNPMEGRFLVFQTLMATVSELVEGVFETEGAWTGSGAHAFYGCQFWKKHWLTDRVDFKNVNSEWLFPNYWIHFEPQLELSDKLSHVAIKLHYETYPYLPKSRLESIVSKSPLNRLWLEKYDTTRIQFKSSFHNELLLIPDCRWHKDNFYLQIASCIVPFDTESIKTFAVLIKDRMIELSSIIDRLIQDHLIKESQWH